MSAFDFLPFGFLSTVELGTIGRYMLTEYALGAIIGIIVSLILIVQAWRQENVQVLWANQYHSIQFGKQFPRHNFEVFPWPSIVVLVQSQNGNVVRERFVSPVGATVDVKYADGQLLETGLVAWGSPVYCCTVLVPCVIGFFPAVLSLFTQVSVPLLISGVIWLMATSFLFPIVAILQQRGDDDRSGA